MGSSLGGGGNVGKKPEGEVVLGRGRKGGGMRLGGRIVGTRLGGGGALEQGWQGGLKGVWERNWEGEGVLE